MKIYYIRRYSEFALLVVIVSSAGKALEIACEFLGVNLIHVTIDKISEIHEGILFST